MPEHLTFRYPSEELTTKVVLGEQVDPDFALLGTIARTIVILTDTSGEKLFGEQLQGRFRKEGFETSLISFPEGEENKSRETKQLLENKMLEEKLGKDICIVALGGGIVCDVAGFVAATYCRGVPYFSIPTTLLAMVDGAHGGKTGVNTPHGKNLIGAFYPPFKVLIDVSSLQSLPEKQWRCGVAEIIKYGLIASKDLFEMMERRREEWRSKNSAFLLEIIRESILIKKWIVEADFKETGLRHTLNFGHTYGHAIETLSHYTVSHGDAVALGMLIEAELSVKEGYLDPKVLERLRTLLQKYHFPLELPAACTPEAFAHQFSFDKKTKGGVPRCVFLSEIGACVPFEGKYCREIP